MEGQAGCGLRFVRIVKGDDLDLARNFGVERLGY